MATPPIRHSSDDLLWMRRALSLAEEMRGHVWPNPPVGCVIVRDGVAIAEAATHAGGRPHAERKALDQAGARARGATLYVTLEPCCHWGKTPPCADAIVEAGVSRVVCAIRDPDPRVNGGGFAKLRSASVEVVVGLCADDAKQVMSGFFHRVRYGEPELIIMERITASIPAGVDAMIASLRDEVHLLTRSGEVRACLPIAGVPTPRLLAHLAEMGLTSVAVSRGDPIAHWLTAAQRHRPHVANRSPSRAESQLSLLSERNKMTVGSDCL